MSMNTQDGVIAQAKRFKSEFMRLQEDKAREQVLRKAPFNLSGCSRMGILRPLSTPAG